MNTETESKPAPTMTFSRAKTAAAATAVTAPPPATSTAVTTPGNPAQGLVGEFNSSDLKKPPVLKYVSGQGELAVSNPEWQGRFVWDAAVELGTECIVIPTRLTKSYREKRPYPDPNTTPPASFRTAEEARASGLPIIAVAVGEFLIELTPEKAKLDPLLSWVVLLDGKPYLPCTIWFQNTAYDCACTLVSDFGRHLKGRFANGTYKLTTKQFQGKTGPYRAMALKSHGPTPDAVKAAIMEEFKI